MKRDQILSAARGFLFTLIPLVVARAFGAKYIANLGSKEIHRVSALTSKCRIEMITNGRYVWNQSKWLKKGFNGCRWCNGKEDKG